MREIEPCPSCGSRAIGMGMCASCGGYVCVFCESRMTVLEGPEHILTHHKDRLLFAVASDPQAFHYWIRETAPRCAKCSTILYDYGICLPCNQFTAADRERNPPVQTIQGIIADEAIPSDEA